MNRSGLIESDDDYQRLNLYRANVDRCIRGRKGQKFLREMAEAMDAMPVKRLIAEELIADDGEVCAIGSVCKSRGIDVSKIDPEDPDNVAAAVGIHRILASEIEYENDDTYWRSRETAEERWLRMRKWIDKNLVDQKVSQ